MNYTSRSTWPASCTAPAWSRSRSIRRARRAAAVTSAGAQGREAVAQGRAGLPPGRARRLAGASSSSPASCDRGGRGHEPASTATRPEPRGATPRGSGMSGHRTTQAYRGAVVTCSFCGTVGRVRRPADHLDLGGRERQAALVLRRLLPHAPARDGEQARLRVVVTGGCGCQSAKPGSESSSTWRNGTRASSWLSTPTPPAKVRWISMYAGRQVQPQHGGVRIAAGVVDPPELLLHPGPREVELLHAGRFEEGPEVGAQLVGVDAGSSRG